MYFINLCLINKNIGIQRIRDYMSLFEVLTRTFSWGIRFQKKYLLFFCLISFIMAVVNFGYMYLMGHIIDVLGQKLQLGDKDFNTIFYLFQVVVLLSMLITIYYEFIKEDYFMQYIGNILYGMNEKAGRLNLIQFESDELYRTINLAMQGVYFSVESIINLISSIMYYAIFFIVISMYMYNINPYLLIFSIFVFIPKLLFQWKKSNEIKMLEKQLVDNKIRVNYLQKYLSDTKYIKEIRVYELEKYFLDLLSKEFYCIVDENTQVRRRILCNELFMQVITYLGHVIILCFLLFLFLNKKISISEFSVVYFSLNLLISQFDELITLLGQILSNLSISTYLYEFLELEEDQREVLELEKSFSSVLLEEVSFCFPYTNNLAIKKINMEIERGQRIAIVGRNGSGKSTLAKIIMGLYIPNSGNVIYKYNFEKLNSKKARINLFSATFQNYIKYKFTLKDNVLISDLNKEYDRGYVQSILINSGIDINDLKLDTVISPEYGGTDCSGGEWQRIAMSRGNYREHQILILDEPTAAIDPLEENKVFQQFLSLANNEKTVIFITHRLASAKIADVIIVMEDGKIIEQGNHETLMREKNLYYKMYNSQSQWYT